MKDNIEDILKDKKKDKKFANNTIYCNDIELIIDKIHSETEMNKLDIRSIIDSQLRMLKQVMGNEGLVKLESNFEDFKSIRLLRLGSFRPSPKKFEYIQKYLREKKENV